MAYARRTPPAQNHEDASGGKARQPKPRTDPPTVAEIARRSGLTRKTIYKYVQKNKIAYVKGYPQIRVDPAEFPHVMARARIVHQRLQAQDTRRSLIDYMAGRDGISERSARRRLERWAKSPRGRVRFDALLQEYKNHLPHED